MSDEEIPSFVSRGGRVRDTVTGESGPELFIPGKRGHIIRAVPPEADLSGGGWIPEGEEDEDVEADDVEDEPVGEDDGGARPD